MSGVLTVTGQTMITANTVSRVKTFVADKVNTAIAMITPAQNAYATVS